MRIKIRCAYLAVAFLFSSCSDDPTSFENSPTAESKTFNDFRFPERYAEIVEKAEGGDQDSISILVDYFTNYPATDIRNLEYWSMKSFEIKGRRELTNLIIAFVIHGKCERAWDVIDKNYPKKSEFPFYRIGSDVEKIDEKCSRKLRKLR